MPRPDITSWSGPLFKRQLRAALDYLDGLGGGGGGSVDWADISGIPADFPPSAHALNAHSQPDGIVDFNEQQAINFCVESRTSDPASPSTGQIWLRTDL